MADQDPVRDALAAPAYETAFDKAMSGRTAELTEEEREAIRAAREAAGVPGPGYPLPWRLDPTRRES